MESMAIVARWLLYLGALVAIGDPCAQWVRGDGWSTRWNPRMDARARARPMGAWLAVMCALVLMFVAQFLALELSPTSADVAMLLRQTAWGNGWLMLAGTAMLGTIAVAARAGLMIRLAIVIAFAIAMSGIGHAAADEAAPRLSRALDAVHVLGIGVWLGTLSYLGEDVTSSWWVRFSRMAVVAAPLTVITGVGSALRRFGAATLPQILSSEYGAYLAAKVALVVVILLIGAWHRRVVRLRGAPTKMSVRIELLLALVVLCVTAVLTGTAPPGE